MQSACPCCGQAVKAIPPEDLARELGHRIGAVVRVLAKQPGQFVSHDVIATFVYRNDPDGGPLHARTSIRSLIAYSRPRLRNHGWTIEGRPGPDGGYRLKIAE